MALNAAFRECGLRLGIDCLRFCFPPRAVNHRSAVVGARKVPREAEVIIPGCMCPSTHPVWQLKTEEFSKVPLSQEPEEEPGAGKAGKGREGG